MTVRRETKRRIGSGLLALLVLLVGLGLVGRPAAAGLFDVEDVKVDVTASSAAAAREAALRQGQAKAYAELIQRLTLPEDRGRIPSAGEEEISALIRDFSVSDEKASAVRYLARLNVHFEPEAVRQRLTDFGVPFVATGSKPVLVLPVYRVSSAAILWEDPNPWRDAWLNRDASGGLVPIVLPEGDLEDVAATSAESAADGDMKGFEQLSRRYGTGTTLVAAAAQGRDPTSGSMELKIALKRYGPVGLQQRALDSFRARGDESFEALMARAVAAIVNDMETRWKRDNILYFDEAAVAVVTVPIGGLDDWLAVRDRLRRVAVLQKADLALLSRREARVNLRYAGSTDQLMVALGQADLRVTQGDTGWVLTLAGSAAR